MMRDRNFRRLKVTLDKLELGLGRETDYMSWDTAAMMMNLGKMKKIRTTMVLRDTSKESSKHNWAPGS